MANAAPDDGELEQLLTQLLRMLSPAVTADDTSGRGRVATAPVIDGHRRPASGAEALQRAPESAAPEEDSAGTASQATESGPAGPAAAGSPGLVPAVSASEARALIQLVSARGIAQGELASLLGLDKSTVSRLAAGLERKGWVRRGRDEGNQRYVRLYLTPQGGEVAARVWQAWQSRRARIMAALSPAERAGLTTGLGGLVRGLAAEGLLSEPPGNGRE
jgi:DNA-binding MarR family transcriptional regulator